MDSNNIISAVSLVVSVLGAGLVAINHKRIRSKCCRQEISASLDIENTTPPGNSSPLEPDPVLNMKVLKLAQSVLAASNKGRNASTTQVLSAMPQQSRHTLPPVEEESA